jgi:hypothetical protein
VALLREQLATAAPLSPLSLRLTARLADNEPAAGRWTVRKEHFSYAIDGG